MKYSFKKCIYSTLLLLILVCSSCQKETNSNVPNDGPQAITASSLLVNLVKNVSAGDGSFDNIVDGASCLAIKFPYTVVVNGEELIINSIADLSQIEARFDAYELDEDELIIHYPITIRLANFAQIIVENETQHNALAEECIENGDDPDNECIDFVYPIALFTFDVNNEQTDRVVVERDAELRLFFGAMKENDRVSFDFPLSLITYDGTQMVVNNNEELIAAINSVSSSCDEDDDSDYNDDDFSEERLNNLLLACDWLIKEVEREEDNLSEIHYLSRLSFQQDGTLNYEDRNGTDVSGTWGIETTNNSVWLHINLENLTALSSDWLVYELEEGVIKLSVSGGNKVILQSTCESHNTEADILSQILQECNWLIKKVKKGEEIEEFLGYNLDFLPNDVLTINDGGTEGGSWGVLIGAQDQPVLNIMMGGNEPSIGFEWPLKNLDYERLVFEDDSGDNKLVLEKNCYNDIYDSEVMDLRTLVADGLWSVTSFTYNTVPNAISYSEPFVFTNEGVFKVDDVDIGANWIIYRNSDGELELILSFESSSNYTQMGNDWKIVEITENRIELSHEDEPGDYDHLIFQRP